jgi:hypothetical protein
MGEAGGGGGVCRFADVGSNLTAAARRNGGMEGSKGGAGASARQVQGAAASPSR